MFQDQKPHKLCEELLLISKQTSEIIFGIRQIEILNHGKRRCIYLFLNHDVVLIFINLFFKNKTSIGVAMML
jgi:hypothetical protein